MKRILLLLLVATPLFARVVRLDVTSRRDAPYGYEQIDGRVYFAVDPANPHNRAVVDLELAPKNAAGEVEFSADVSILRPRHGGNGTLFLEIPNRGGKSGLGFPDRDDFLLLRGYTVAHLGWQFDVRDEAGRLRLYAPVARGVRGRVRSDFIVTAKTDEHSIGHVITGTLGGKGYPVADRNDRANLLTERDEPTSPRRIIPRTKWRFTSDSTIALDGGFVPGKIYEIAYTAADPAVVGAGFAAVRDFVAYAKHSPDAVARASTAYGFGISQSGRFLRHFVHDGFNADEDGRQVFDGLLVHVAGAGRGNFNHRFAQPSRDAQPIVPAFYPVDVPPFTDVPGLLDRAVAEKVVPKIFYTNTSYEYWSRGGSLIHTTPDGRADVEPPPTTRVYLLAGLGHVGGEFPPVKPDFAQQLQNFMNYWPVTHALIDAMDAWVKKGTAPPPSRYPRISDGTLVRVEDLAVKDGPRFAYQPYTVNLSHRSDAPSSNGTYTALVPQVDADGNELAGVRMPFLAAPLARFTGWNLRAPAIGFPEYRASFIGAVFPFPKTKIARRYRDRDEYLGRFTAATMQLVEDRFLVAEEVHRLLRQGLELWNWIP